MIKAYTYHLSSGGRGYGVMLNNESYYVALDDLDKKTSWGHFSRNMKEKNLIYYDSHKSNEIPIIARRFLVERVFKG